MYGKTWQALAVSLLLTGWSAGAAGQGSVQLGSDGAPAGSEVSGTAAAGAGDAEDELLFVDGPREPGVLSEAGSLIRTGARTREASSGQGDAVSALVASAVGEEDVSTAEAGESAESEEEPRKGVRGLFRSLGGLLGLGRDSLSPERRGRGRLRAPGRSLGTAALIFTLPPCRRSRRRRPLPPR